MSYQTDATGKVFTTNDGKAPGAYGVPVQIHTPTGRVSGTWQNGHAVPDKK
jgi:hypothetical protein